MNRVTINDETNYKRWKFLEGVLVHALKMLHIENAEASVILVDEKKITELNRKYRNIDAPTDVISFAFEDTPDLLYNELRLLGEVYICVPVMIHQADNYGHGEKRELSFLGVHGLLHLLGYNHENTKDEKVMRELEERILSAKNIKK